MPLTGCPAPLVYECLKMGFLIELSPYEIEPDRSTEYWTTLCRVIWIEIWANTLRGTLPLSVDKNWTLASMPLEDEEEYQAPPSLKNVPSMRISRTLCTQSPNWILSLWLEFFFFFLKKNFLLHPFFIWINLFVV